MDEFSRFDFPVRLEDAFSTPFPFFFGDDEEVGNWKR
jgi:hypothetical protein